MDENAQRAGDPEVDQRPHPVEVDSARPSDATLLGRVSRGDQEAFEELYDRYVAPAHGLVLAVVGDAERAAEVVAELFMDLWQSPYELSSTPGAAPSRFSTRILAAAHRRAVEAARAHRQGLTAGDAPDRSVSDPAARILRGIVDPDALTAFRLAYFDARTLGEIAARMEVSRSSVASLLNRGLEGLRRSPRAP